MCALNRFWNSNLSLFLAVPLIFVTAATMAGPKDGGGGNADSGSLLGVSDIHQILESIQPLTAAYFKYSSVADTSDVGYYGDAARAPIGNLLFSGPHRDAIMQKVFAVKPMILDQGPCASPLNETREGAASRNPDSVCFSPELLAKRGDIRSSNAYSILVALAVHEYSHLLGTTEEEAVFVQGVALKDFSNQAGRIVSDEFRNSKLSLSRAEDQFLKLKQIVAGKSSMLDICTALSTDLYGFNNISGGLFYQKDGVSYLSRYEYDQVLKAASKSQNYLAFCKGDEATKQWRQKIFGNLKVIDLPTYMARNNAVSGSIIVEGKVRRIDFGDRNALQLELDDLVTAAHFAANAWPTM